LAARLSQRIKLGSGARHWQSILNIWTLNSWTSK
jgi:hypothetical protein